MTRLTFFFPGDAATVNCPLPSGVAFGASFNQKLDAAVEAQLCFQPKPQRSSIRDRLPELPLSRRLRAYGLHQHLGVGRVTTLLTQPEAVLPNGGRGLDAARVMP